LVREDVTSRNHDVGHDGCQGGDDVMAPNDDVNQAYDDVTGCLEDGRTLLVAVPLCPAVARRKGYKIRAVTARTESQ